MKIVVLGAGAWGTALALSACQHRAGGHTVTLWARDAAQAALMQAHRENARYLPGVTLPVALGVSSARLPDAGAAPAAISSATPDSFGALIGGADLLILATPMAALRAMLTHLSACRVPVAWLCKGFEAAPSSEAFGLLAHEVQAQIAPDLIAGALSGPSFALEVARGQPTALVAASVHAVVRDTLVAAFHSPTLRVYANDDIAGVEVGGAVKNVLAIAVGLCDGLNLGLNARAALITRGLAEMTRLGVALGAQAETFMGLTGLGDLVLTATGDLSRNRQVGLALAKGQTLAQAVAALGHVAEGVYSARTVVQRASQVGVEMPIAQAVVALLDGQIKPAEAVAALMGRDPASEQA
ncbi:MAG: NAD(P)-dependent glycerol-3-phosphate dehydrogenase [Gammaproteobacteria bacterium]|uniref:NAD(P)H-dependent glycerol-3-phosphate dehydrogenase n=1 Tax=Rhodoferax sp. TaxID=50421 RepID=UPI0018549923|nr:NAD(P)H-dependent glycerol-3-phosphate dehydrogenase [Rhodoferax sp.]MBU3897375.1 NAD(P)-dependent glycerol-3-phosphate dehydrogenase [Gammaproteobacteria bacterium]MBA3058807.1 NAD(P)-dependent glycerol-3-phosphate dehydrogenase [Rhodoferax sp.]MBU3999254.1 NAD(P)-dependent glycerol-3-phosphate dehydrogenase [Gammaproteobacteria bacterium]MBU4018721.1 NAD(P)-dependent glycerol-3-phosphate dehydrogenase [Gammaproteobacteria bacterium]MBU4079676.1 NAD(P)-dependent glycerol-3-phosphate dehydr